ncbi:MAG: hypothetical protein FVQ80_06860 [Planctomycetes bacterium]|nr:hypothetical protein [Planctomycetota bacterium]
MIDSAKGCGADAVKFQVYDPKLLLNPDSFSLSNWQSILRSELNFGDVAVLFEHCRKAGIEFLASAFDLKRLDWLEELGVKRHKIASRSIYDKELVEAVKKTGKPYLVSMGMIEEMHKMEPIYGTWSRLAGTGGNCTFMYCVSEYPTSLSKIDFHSSIFKRVNPLSVERFDGFSDHTVGTTTAKTAIVLGAKVVEKHFTLNKHADGPDHCCSADINELWNICDFRNDFNKLDWR